MEMKTKLFGKLAALMVGAAVICGVMLPLSACSSESDVNLADYAQEYTHGTKSGKGIYQYRELSAWSGLSVVDSEQEIVTLRGTSGYLVYNLDTEKVLIADLVEKPYSLSYNPCGDVRMIRVLRGKNRISYYDYYDYNGKLLVGQSPRLDCQLKTLYVDGVEAEVLCIIPYDASDNRDEENQLYYLVARDEETGKITDYFYVEKYQVSQSASGDDSIGSVVNPLITKIYEESETRPVEGEICDYGYINVGDVYTFYKDGEITGSVHIKQGAKLGFVDRYFYYFTATPVKPDNWGYNFVILSTYNNTKFDYKLFRYDIIDNSTREMGGDYAVIDMTPLYNYNKKCYDAATCIALEKYDGAFFVEASSGAGAGSAYVMDTELRPACNLSKLDVTSLGNFYKFGADKYIIGNYIVDNDLNILNSASSGNIYLDEGLIKFGKDGLYGFTDLSGKVVIEANYRGDFEFYDGVTYVKRVNDNNSVSHVLLKSDGTETDLSEYEESGAVLDVYDGFFTVRDSYARTFTVYNFNNNNILSLTINAGTSYTVKQYGSVYVLKADSGLAGGLYYKLC